MDEEEDGDPRRELVDQLIEYQKYKKLGELIQRTAREGEWLIERKRSQIALPFDDDDRVWEEVAVWDLLKVFSNLIASISMEKIVDLYEEVTVNEKITLVNELLEERKEFVFIDLIKKIDSALEIVCAFLAILELVKQKRISIYQNRLFGDIRIMRHPLENTDGK